MTRRRVLLHDLLDTAAHAWPDQPAVSGAGASLTFAELSAASRRAADWLLETGLSRGDRVVLASGSAVLTAATIWGASRAGVVFIVVHERVRGTPLTHILADSEAGLLIADTAEATTTATALGIRAVAAAEVADRILRGPDPARPVHQAPLAVDPACMIYTSGSTAAPKAVVSTHAQMVFAVEAIDSVLRYRPDDVVYCPLPLSFDYGMYQLFLGADSGAHVRVGQPAEVGPTLVKNLRAAGATVLAGVPAVTGALARLLRRAPAPDLPLRLLTNTGAAMSQATLDELRAQLPRIKVQLMFGLTECKRATIMPPDGDLVRPGASGRALPGTEILIVDDDGKALPAGMIGQIVVRGPHVMAGYWRRPELTAQRFHRAQGLFPELRTGDYGWVDAEGYLYFVGRRDDIYKQSGFRVSATEVEAAAMRVPGVDAAAVLPPSDDRPATLLVVTRLPEAEVLARLREELEEFKIPPRYEVLAALPLSGNGKVDKKALASSLAERADV
ncbi:class I adenylate-forming enzyme family protein [Dactylosporangium cerinum]|uniref:Class I adenylate-forming enzyme family protein n=1 Tax=Dactylosporangium cerinum TaxID=1434730 RepID=A0ABV9W2B2_9ACTN